MMIRETLEFCYKEVPLRCVSDKISYVISKAKVNRKRAEENLVRCLFIVHSPN